MGAMRNREVVELFSRVADMLAIRGDQIHRILAYRKAAESVEALGRDINVVYAEGKLTDIPGIGDTLAAKIEEMLTTGRLAFYDKLAQEIPPGLVDMLRVEGLGPKRVKQVYETLKITDAGRTDRRRPAKGSCATCRAWGPSRRPRFWPASRRWPATATHAFRWVWPGPSPRQCSMN
jgi:DNA polymerase/3'-5' exonuclease PolX